MIISISLPYLRPSFCFHVFALNSKLLNIFQTIFAHSDHRLLRCPFLFHFSILVLNPCAFLQPFSLILAELVGGENSGVCAL